MKNSFFLKILRIAEYCIQTNPTDESNRRFYEREISKYYKILNL
jgi:hypothetical protein